MFSKASAATNTVWIVAWLPIALFLSAVYSESLFLLLVIGSFYAARLGRWPAAGALGPWRRRLETAAWSWSSR